MCLPNFVHAQIEQARVETIRQAADELSVTQAPLESHEKKLPPLQSPEAEAEFGSLVVLQRQAVFDPWHVRLKMQGFHTDNVALAPREVEDYFMRYGAELSYSNRLAGSWNFEAALEQDFIRYDRFTSLDYDMTSAMTGVSTKLSWLAGATFALRYYFEYLTESGFGEEITTGHSLYAGLFKSWSLGGGHRLQLGLTSQPELHTDPDFARRHEHAAFATWSFKLTDKLTARLTGRAAYRQRPEADREDWNYVARASASYALNDWANVSASTSLTWNHSSENRFDYRNQRTGVFVGFDFKF